MYGCGATTDDLSAHGVTARTPQRNACPVPPFLTASGVPLCGGSASGAPPRPLTVSHGAARLLRPLVLSTRPGRWVQSGVTLHLPFTSSL